MAREVRRAWLPAVAVAAGMLLASAGCSGTGGGDGGRSAAAAARARAAHAAAQARLMRTGRRVYVEQCDFCHRLLGHRAPRTPKPDEYGVSFDEVALPAAYVARRVHDGFGGMQSFGGELSSFEIRAVAAYVAAVGGRAVTGEPASAASVAAGRAVFAARCASCHAIAHSVPSGREVWTPTDFRVVKPSARLVREILRGRTLPLMGEFMKRLRGKLTAREIHDVAAYVSATAGPGGASARGSG